MIDEIEKLEKLIDYGTVPLDNGLFRLLGRELESWPEFKWPIARANGTWASTRPKFSIAPMGFLVNRR